jgi:hypothetical protein
MLWDIVNTESKRPLVMDAPLEAETEDEARAIALAAVGRSVAPHVCLTASCRISHGAIVDRGEPGGAYEDEDHEGPEPTDYSRQAHEREESYHVQRDFKR